MLYRRKKEKGQVRLGTPAGPLETGDDRKWWRQEVTLGGNRSVLSFKSSPFWVACFVC